MCCFMESVFVTVFTGDPKRFVADHALPIAHVRRMAFLACDVRMGFVQGKSRTGVVIKCYALPGLCGMARLTTCRSPLCKLAGVRVRVTWCTRECDTRVFHGIPLFVATDAWNSFVLPVEREFGLVMIKEGCRPGIRDVAHLTGLLFFGELVLVRILVTCPAGEILVPPVLPRAFGLNDASLVARNATRGNMRSRQRECAVEMTFHGIERDRKIPVSVTSFA